MLDWILKNLGVVIFLVIFISQILRAFLNAKKASAQHEAEHDESAEARRVREVQEQIRRQIAQRRGGSAPVAPTAPPPLERASEPAPTPRPQTTQLPELFGGPLGRMLEELQKRAQPPAEPPPRPAYVETRNNAEIERQQQLADRLKELEDQRAVVQRRAAHVASDQRILAASEPALRTAARDLVTADLANPNALRRAFVLREVLGPPVAFR
ncbi:hypothetical protein [Horticoccus sp. 23ND18S-11]|uniref:hypothetical protein n=1 Tax=Horticoccus sp. 23ND18S-11 TaxID=3391832 RepID=UPI0039C9D07C